MCMPWTPCTTLQCAQMLVSQVPCFVFAEAAKDVVLAQKPVISDTQVRTGIGVCARGLMGGLPGVCPSLPTTCIAQSSNAPIPELSAPVTAVAPA